MAKVCKKLSMWLFMLVGLSLVINLVAFIAPAWYASQLGHTGLLRWCKYYPHVCQSDLQHHNDQQKAAAGVMVVALGGHIMATVCHILYNCDNGKETAMKLQIPGLFIAAACALTAVILWGSGNGSFREVFGSCEMSLGWAYRMVICSCVHTTAVGMLAIFNLYRRSKQKRISEAETFRI